MKVISLFPQRNFFNDFYNEEEAGFHLENCPYPGEGGGGNWSNLDSKEGFEFDGGGTSKFGADMEVVYST